MLFWGTPTKVRSTDEHNATHVADSAPPGVYVPNMSSQDMARWKAKKVNGQDPRVEVRKSTKGTLRPGERSPSFAQALLIVRPDGTVTISSNGKAEFNIVELAEALIEAQETLK